MGSLFKPKTPKTPSKEQVEKEQENIAAKDKQKLAMESAERERSTQEIVKRTESTRQAFVGGLTSLEDEEQRKRFLKGA